MKKTIFMTFALLLSSCVPESAGTGRGTFTSSEQAVTCTDSFFILSTGDTCSTSCPTNTKEASDEEKQAILTDETISDSIKEIVQTSAGVCIDVAQVESRPDNNIFVDGGFCVCKNQKVASINSDVSCTATCSTKNVSVATLYGAVSVGALIQGNEKLKNLHGFCTSDLDNNPSNAASCKLIAKDSLGSESSINLVTTSGSNNFSATLEGNLNFNTTYTLKIKETGSGVENAGSDSFHVRLKEPDDDGLDIIGDLRIKLVGQYSCFIRIPAEDNATKENYYLDTANYHFYLPANTPVTPMAAGVVDRLFCHDYIKENSLNDSPKFTRLEFIPDHFALWDINDPRFIQDGSNLTVDFLIQEEMEKLNVSNPPLKSYFSQLNGCVAPDDSGGPCISSIIGMALRPFVDSSGKSFCPGISDYIGDNPEMVALGQVLGNPTEGVYYAEGPKQTLVISETGETQQFDSDVIMIRENILKKIYFHFGAGGLPIKPKPSTENQPTYFYWPPDYDNPYVQKLGYQKLYTVKTISELINKDRVTEVPSTLTPHDRKTACIPALSE